MNNMDLQRKPYEQRSPRRFGHRLSLRSSLRGSSVASTTSSQSSQSTEGGGKIKLSFNSTSMLSRCQSLDLRRPSGKDRQVKVDSSKSLRRSTRRSLPTIHDPHAISTRTRSKASSNKNEEWDLLCSKPPALSLEQKLKITAPGSSPPKSSLKVASRALTSKSMHVGFDDAPFGVVFHDAARGSLEEKWHAESEVEQFCRNAAIRARIIDRTMKYAASVERTFNSSTGLTAPQVLKEYLSNPEDVIGIEHLLSCQQSVRENLKAHHKNALLEGQCRRVGCDQETLASRLGHSSAIAARMARERAAYITHLD